LLTGADCFLSAPACLHLVIEPQPRRSDPDTPYTAAETDTDDEAIIEAFFKRRMKPDGEDGP
jgi:hypothetical protein